MRQPFYNVTWPQYLNYGTLGSLIGHAIFHAFDSTGRKFDKAGDYKNCWQADTELEFLRRAQCIIDQYSNMTVPKVDVHVYISI